MSSTEQLIVELQADSKHLEKGLADVNRDMARLTRESNQADRSLISFSKAGKIAGNAITTTAKGVAATATALAAMITLSAKSEQELGVLATTAGTTTKEFSSLAFAFAQVGIDAKGTSDAMNDVTESMAEFALAESGTMQDFADAVGLTTAEAKELATELQGLSGEDALLELTKKMQDLNVPAAQMSFALKSISADLAYTTDLMADQGAELKRLKARYDEMNTSMAITGEQSKNLSKAAESFDLLTSSIGKSTTAISASLAPVFTDFIDEVIKEIPKATQAIVDFINSFKAPEDIDNLVSVQNQLAESEKEMLILTKQKKALSEEFYSKDLTNKQTSAYEQAVINEQTKAYEEKLKAINAEIIEQGQLTSQLTAQEAELIAQRDAEAEGESPATTTTDTPTTGTSAGSADELAALEDSFKTEEQLLTDKYEKDQALAKDNADLLTQIDAKYYADRAQIQTDADQAMLDLKDTADLEAEKKAEELEAYQTYLMSKEELLAQYKENEYNAILDAQEALTDQATAQYEQGLIDEQEYQDAINKIQEDAGRKTKGVNDNLMQGDKDKEASEKAYLGAAKQIGNALFEDNKAIGAGLIVADTAVAAMKAYKEVPYPANIVASAGAVAAGAAQLANLNGASKGGGSVSSTAGTAPPPATTTVEQSGTVQGQAGNQQVNLVIESTDDNATAELVNSLLSGASVNGNI